ncbi:hypothetical protein K469DRAFT_668256 [Zopfia rhizophila CBS 207.26]|uniref:Uncharacterized protein n=1 Tax=Zopfia rhizophila CBS 207.26 TaxID=1314779 RepID=A0A6A6DX30_9PEZI|nr:hypothetical protein K469DRAFT_668256 [Zopfia rhizophila CBS 207.26]
MSPHGLVPVSIVSRYVGSQDSRVNRGLCTTVSMLCMFWLAFIFGSRPKRLRLNNLTPINWIRLIIILLYVFAICFVSTAAILTSGLGLTSKRDCFTAVFACLLFYFGNKMIMYMFLIERAHIIRAPYERRINDKVWIARMFFLIVGFGAISVTAFMWPNAVVSPLDGKCRIGQPLKVTIPLLTYDIVVNVSLTVLFVHFLYPFLAPKGNRISLGQPLSSLKFFSQRKSPNCSSNQDPVTGRLRRLVVKTVIGGVLVMIPTVAKLTGVLITRGREQGWMCLTLCSLDGKSRCSSRRLREPANITQSPGQLLLFIG